MKLWRRVVWLSAGYYQNGLSHTALLEGDSILRRAYCKGRSALCECLCGNGGWSAPQRRYTRGQREKREEGTYFKSGVAGDRTPDLISDRLAQADRGIFAHGNRLRHLPDDGQTDRNPIRPSSAFGRRPECAHVTLDHRVRSDGENANCHPSTSDLWECIDESHKRESSSGRINDRFSKSGFLKHDNNDRRGIPKEAVAVNVRQQHQLRGMFGGRHIDQHYRHYPQHHHQLGLQLQPAFLTYVCGSDYGGDDDSSTSYEWGGRLVDGGERVHEANRRCVVWPQESTAWLSFPGAEDTNSGNRDTVSVEDGGSSVQPPRLDATQFQSAMKASVMDWTSHVSGAFGWGSLSTVSSSSSSPQSASASSLSVSTCIDDRRCLSVPSAPPDRASPASSSSYPATSCSLFAPIVFRRRHYSFSSGSMPSLRTTACKPSQLVLSLTASTLLPAIGSDHRSHRPHRPSSGHFNRDPVASDSKSRNIRLRYLPSSSAHLPSSFLASFFVLPPSPPQPGVTVAAAAVPSTSTSVKPSDLPQPSSHSFPSASLSLKGPQLWLSSARGMVDRKSTLLSSFGNHRHITTKSSPSLLDILQPSLRWPQQSSFRPPTHTASSSAIFPKNGATNVGEGRRMVIPNVDIRRSECSWEDPRKHCIRKFHCSSGGVKESDGGGDGDGNARGGRAVEDGRRRVWYGEHAKLSDGDDDCRDGSSKKDSSSIGSGFSGASRSRPSISELLDQAGWTKEEVVNWPNAISTARLISGPVIAMLVMQGNFSAALIGLAAAGISDWLDGFIAKRYGGSSVLGSYLDPLADKVLVCSLTIALAANGHLSPGLVALIVSRDAALVGGAFVYRAYRLSWQWQGVSDFFKVSDGGAPKVQPLLISKVNMVAQLSLVGLALLRAASGFPDVAVLDNLGYVVAGTTVLSWAGYGHMLLQQARRGGAHANASAPSLTSTTSKSNIVVEPAHFSTCDQNNNINNTNDDDDDGRSPTASPTEAGGEDRRGRQNA